MTTTTQVQTRSVEETLELGERIAAQLQGGETLLLQGDLGVGKTQLTKGIARGLGVTAEVVSPTFTLVVQYDGRFPLAHYDLYRVESSADLQEIGYLEEDDNQTVRVVEWGERAPTPPGAIHIRIAMVDAETRSIEVQGLQLDSADRGRR